MGRCKSATYFCGGLKPWSRVMSIAARCSTVLFMLVIPSACAEAASLISRFEYHSFWADILPIFVMLVIAVIGTWLLRKKIRQQVAAAPPEARRSLPERRLHRLSLIFLAAPMIYALLLDADLLFPFFAMLAIQTMILTGLRALGVSFEWRLYFIAVAALLSIIAGAMIASWPELTRLPTLDQVWALAAAAACFALGGLLSYLSFPPAFRERAW